MFYLGGFVYSRDCIDMIRVVLEEAISAVWISLALASLSVALFPQLSFVSKHGKMQEYNTEDKKSFSKMKLKSIFDLKAVTVPKYWFSHMYILGLCTGILGLYTVIISSPSPPKQLFGAYGLLMTVPVVGSVYISADPTTFIVLTLLMPPNSFY